MPEASIFFGRPNKDNHRIDRINTDIHHGPIRQLRLESVQHDSFLELIITGGILAIAGEITTNRTYTPKILSHGKKVRRKRRLHRLHQRDIICTGSLDHRTYFFRVGSEGFLAKNMLAIAHAKNTLGGMKEVREAIYTASINGLFRHLLQGGKRIRYIMFRGESIRRPLSSRIYSYQFKTLILPGSGNYPITYEIGSDYTKTYFYPYSIVLCSLFTNVRFLFNINTPWKCYCIYKMDKPQELFRDDAV